MTVPNNELKAFVDRIENIESERKQLKDDADSIYAEAKSSGFDPKIIRKLIALRKKKEDVLKEEAELLAVYADALGMQGTLFP